MRSIAFVVGIALRIPLHKDPSKKTLYIVEDTLIILSPVGFIASNLLLFSHLITRLDCRSFMFLRAKYITSMFLVSNALGGIMQVCYFSTTASNYRSVLIISNPERPQEDIFLLLLIQIVES